MGKTDSDNTATPVAIALGGNLGDVPATFASVIDELAESGMTDVRMSHLYKTAPVDCAPGAPDFVNAALLGRWRGSAGELHNVCKALEAKHGRLEARAKNSDRPLDLDIIFFGFEIIRTPSLTIPHPLAAKRLFVLVPLADLDGGMVFPDTGKTVSEAIAGFEGDELPPEKILR